MRWFILSLLLLWPLTLWAQSQEEEDKGFITELLQDSLSTDDQVVTIDGFSGVISGNPAFERLTIADENGVWLTMEGAKLRWRQSALVFGAIDINELSAEVLIIERLPEGEPKANTPTAEATPFSLPELPLSVKVDGFAIDRVELGAPVLGQAIQFSVGGSADLEDGEGTLSVSANRIDNIDGQFLIDGNYSNETQILDINLDLSEDPNGIVSHVLGLPGDPSVALTVSGNGPITDFTANLDLATDGAQRLAGTFALRTEGTNQFVDLAVAGDITPLFAPEYAAFFGTDVTLNASAQLSDDGAIVVDELDIMAEQFQLSGAINISNTGWPNTLNMSGNMASSDGSPVLLPISGEKVFVQSMQFQLAFDAAISDQLTLSFDISQLSRAELAIARIALGGSGIIRETDLLFETELDYLADEIVVGDDGLGEALGDRINGELNLARRNKSAFLVERFTLEGPGLTADATGAIRTKDGLEIESQVELQASDLGRFAGLIGIPLEGRGTLDIASVVRPLDGIFDIELSGDTQDLAIGQDRIDPILSGAGKVAFTFERDTTGTRVDDLLVETNAASISGRAVLTSVESDVSLSAAITDVGLVEPSVSGPASISLTAEQNEVGNLVFDASGEGPDLEFQTDGTYVFNDLGNTFQGKLDAAISDLATYATLAQRDIGGAVTITAKGVLLGDSQKFDAELESQTSDLQIGDDRIDPLLAGPGDLKLDIARVGSERFILKSLFLQTDAVEIGANGSVSLPSDVEGEIKAELRRTDLILPGITTPLSAKLNATEADNGTAVTATMFGAGIDANADLNFTRTAGVIALNGVAAADIETLEPFQELAGLPLFGGVSANVRGNLSSDLEAIDLTFSASGSDLEIGNETVDKLISGESILSGRLLRNDDAFRLEALNVETDELKMNADIDSEGSTGKADFTSELRNIGLFTDVATGPLSTNGTAIRDNSTWYLDIDSRGPGGINAQVIGQVFDDLEMNLNATGGAPLDLVNGVIAPRRVSGFADFNLAVVGPPTVGSVSGTISTDGTRLTLPTVGEAFEDITGTVQLSNGTATVGFTAASATGGGIEISGPVSLQAPFDADIRVGVNDVVVRDPTLYETTINGSIRASGPLGGGAAITGDLDLGETEVRVPSSSVGTLGSLPEIRHIGASEAVNQTISRAGITAPQSSEVSSGDSGPAFPLDITISAPSRIFIRGRGLDAELGGELTVSGTTQNVIPTGQFDLIRGRLSILTQRFDLTEGSATIQGDFTPYIRLVAETEAPTGTNIRIILEGPISEPEIGLESDPDLPPDEALAQLIFGRDLDEITPFQAVRLASAVSTLAGNGGGALNSFREDLGLDDFDVVLDGDGNAAVRAGAYLGENVYTDVTVSSDGSTEINLNLDISPSVTAKGTVDSDGESSIGIFFERDY